MLCFLNAVVQSSQDCAVHNSLSPGKLTTVSSSSEILSLLSQRDVTMGFEICFPKTFSWVKLSCWQVRRVQHTASAAKPAKGQVLAGHRSSLKEGGLQIEYPGSPCYAEQH